MTKNDVLRRLRYALRLNNQQLVDLFESVGVKMPHYHLEKVLKKDDEEDFARLHDDQLADFLDALIIHFRGKKDGQEPTPWPKGEFLSNNEIFKKLRIALSLTDVQIIEMMNKAGFSVSKPELSALFRNPSHRNYKPCKNQMLRNFLTALVKQERPDAAKTQKEPGSPDPKTYTKPKAKPEAKAKPKPAKGPNADIWNKVNKG